MAKQKRPHAAGAPAANDKPATLKDLLSADVLERLKQTSDDLKASERKQQEEARQQKETERKAEQKRLDNDFEHLLKNSSMDWRTFK